MNFFRRKGLRVADRFRKTLDRASIRVARELRVAPMVSSRQSAS